MIFVQFYRKQLYVSVFRIFVLFFRYGVYVDFHTENVNMLDTY